MVITELAHLLNPLRTNSSSGTGPVLRYEIILDDLRHWFTLFLIDRKTFVIFIFLYFFIWKMCPLRNSYSSYLFTCATWRDHLSFNLLLVTQQRSTTTEIYIGTKLVWLVAWNKNDLHLELRKCPLRNRRATTRKCWTILICFCLILVP